MPKLPVFLALFAALGGAASMILAVIAPRGALMTGIFITAMMITFGALSSASRLTSKSRG